MVLCVKELRETDCQRHFDWPNSFIRQLSYFKTFRGDESLMSQHRNGFAPLQLLGSYYCYYSAAVLTKSSVPLSCDMTCVDKGDQSWVMISTVLVLGMIPALGFFEAGLLR